MPTDLWRFAQTLYQARDVEATCLLLQNEGADVCLLLCAAWLERRQIACTEEHAEALRELAYSWRQQVVVPLRCLRQGWREAAQSDETLARLREQVKQLELAAEREQLERLAARCQAWEAVRTDASPDWLECLAPAQASRDALHRLRVAAAHLTA
ncbi:TIGR02444 family protein [Pseudomonas sp. SL4(2022)]|uniref:TIGR02444 family protein n=1 Tax=Pseudomonas sp. SL4(2022) TaxID=2994661 RepID=UPI002271E82F|nr:TIGR02444 family protein [Pseudomonas sp. SL4(2022)]WAC45898.1 TIGR02444 family protein [Pseudomonas sp. SL4(2022)]